MIIKASRTQTLNEISRMGDKLPDDKSVSIRGSTGSNRMPFPGELLGDESSSLFKRVFVNEITDETRILAFQRTMGRRIMSKPVFDALAPGFNVEDLTTTESPEKKPTNRAMQIFDEKIETPLRQAAILARLLGYSLLFITYSEKDESITIEKERGKEARPSKIEAIPKSWVQEELYEQNVLPKKLIGYKLIDEKFGANYIIHPSRIIRIDNSEIDMETGSVGGSSMDGVFDTLTAQQSILYAASVTFWRLAAGLLKVHMPPEADEDDESQVINSLSNMNVKTVITEPDGYLLEALKTGESTLNPTPYYELTENQLAGQSGIPKSILFGLSTGSVSGSELDRKNYIDFTISIQKWLTQYLKELLKLFGAFDPETQVIRWNTPRFETKEELMNRDKIRAETDNLDVRSFIKTPNDIRQRDGVPPLTSTDLEVLQAVGSGKGENLQPKESRKKDPTVFQKPDAT